MEEGLERDSNDETKEGDHDKYKIHNQELHESTCLTRFERVTASLY